MKEYLPERTSGFATGGFRLSGDGKLIEKRLCLPAGGGGRDDLWKNECQFYRDCADLLADGPIRLPRLIAADTGSPDAITLRLEFIPACTRVGTEAAKLDLAHAFGRFAALARHRRACAFPWLPRCRGLGAFQMNTLPEGCNAATAKAFQRVSERLPFIREAYGECKVTLVHGDANDNNILHDQKGDNFVAVDWARVQHGRLGGDLPRLIYPWFITESKSDFAWIERCMLDRYMQGARSLWSKADATLALRAFRIRLLSLSTGLMPYLTPWLEMAPTSSERKLCLRRIEAFYDHVANHARALTD